MNSGCAIPARSWAGFGGSKGAVALVDMTSVMALAKRWSEARLRSAKCWYARQNQKASPAAPAMSSNAKTCFIGKV